VARTRCGPTCGGENPSWVFGLIHRVFGVMLQRSGGRVKLASGKGLRWLDNMSHSEIREIRSAR
jgi:hypothetical protein